MREFISNLIGNDYLATILMSFFPLIELKGGIVFAWDKLGPVLSFLLAYVGSTIVFIPVFWLLKPVLNLLKKIKFINNFALKIEKYFADKADETLKKQTEKSSGKALSQEFIKRLGVFIFVAIPLPMTGVWTGTAIAVFLNLKFKESALPIILGNFIAGLLICGLSALCNLIDINLDIVLWALFILAGVILIITILKISTKKTKEEKE